MEVGRMRIERVHVTHPLSWRPDSSGTHALQSSCPNKFGVNGTVLSRLDLQTMTGKMTGLGELQGEQFDIADLVAYQDGTIVSRTLVDGESATITVFALDEGQRINEHSAPHDALLQVVDGTGEVTIDGDAYTLESGTSIVFPAAVPHAVAAPTRFKMVLTMLR